MIQGNHCNIELQSLNQRYIPGNCLVCSGQTRFLSLKSWVNITSVPIEILINKHLHLHSTTIHQNSDDYTSALRKQTLKKIYIIIIINKN